MNSLIYNSANSAMTADNWAAYDVRAMLVGHSYTPSPAHVYVRHVRGELTDPSYERLPITGRFGAIDETVGLVSFAANNPTWVALGGGEQVHFLVLFKQVSNDDDSLLLYCLELSPFVTRGDNVVLKFNRGVTAGVVFQMKMVAPVATPWPPGMSFKEKVPTHGRPMTSRHRK